MTGRLSIAALVVALALSAMPVWAETPAVPAAPEAPSGSSEPGPDEGDFDAYEREPNVSIFGDVHVPKGTVHRGEIVCIGGNVRIDGVVTGEVVVIVGSLELNGVARSEVVGVASALLLGENAKIAGDLVNVVGSLEDRGGSIGGNRVNLPLGFGIPRIRAPFAVIGAILWWGTVVSLALFFLAILILGALAPDRIRTLGEAVPAQALWAFLAGLGAYAALLVVEFLLVVTVIGIPLLVALHFVFFVLKWLGMIGILHFFGGRLGRLFGRELSLLGATLLGFALLAMLKLAPFLLSGLAGILVLIAVKLLIWLFLEVPAIGLIVLTRVGRPRRPLATAPVVPPTVVVPSGAVPGPTSPPVA
jgi:hypothetical protein